MSKFVFTKKRKLAVLKRMRELLGKRGGWIRYSFNNGIGGYCLLGAENESLLELYRQNGLLIDPDGSRLSIHEAAMNRGYRRVSRFNDDPKTRKKDVLALLDEKIAELES